MRKTISLKNKKALQGFLFAVPFLIGFIVLFLSPLLLYVKFSFSEIYPGNNEMIIKNIGLDNYFKILFVESGYIKSVLENLGAIVLMVPSILMYSFFFASILNQKFKGRTFARAMFFLPVIISSGVALVAQQDSIISSAFGMLNSTSGDSLNLTKVVAEFFGASLSPAFFAIISDIIGQIFFIVSSSGVQIIIFLAALQTISPSLYEASSIEGATPWEDFWKITLPIISPMILVNTVYTIVDQLGGMTNGFIENLYTLSVKNQQYGASAAMGILYFIVMFAILGITIYFISKLVFYENR